MNKLQKMNLVCFLVVVFIMSSFVYILGKMDFSGPFGKPWHLQPSVHEDSLSQEYVSDYKILDHTSLVKQWYDSSRVNLFILVNAWGVPINEEKLKKEFYSFRNVPHNSMLHQRLANRTKHAERVEFRHMVHSSIYLFGGDSLEYSRKKYIGELGFDKTLFCQNCSDSLMLSKVDSLLLNDSFRFLAWTTNSSRTGDEDSLTKALDQIAFFAQHHPEVNVVVQGSHRPILGTSEVRNSYKSHWVPVIILNGIIKKVNYDEF